MPSTIVARRPDAWLPTIAEASERAEAYLEERAQAANRIPRHTEVGEEIELGEPVR